MTANVITSSGDAAGRAGNKPAFSRTAKPLITAHYTFQAGTDNYTSDGWDISDIFDDFSTVLYIGIEQMDTSTAADRREFACDYSAKTIVQYDAFNTEETASDQSVVKLSLLVAGY